MARAGLCPLSKYSSRALPSCHGTTQPLASLVLADIRIKKGPDRVEAKGFPGEERGGRSSLPEIWISD